VIEPNLFTIFALLSIFLFYRRLSSLKIIKNTWKKVINFVRKIKVKSKTIKLTKKSLKLTFENV
jgi:hypothetical protein